MCIYIYIFPLFFDVYMYMRVEILEATMPIRRLPLQKYVCMCVYICICIHIFIYIYLCIYTYMYTCTNILG